MNKNPKKVLVLVNRDFVLYNFRFELVERLLELGEEVYICLPDGPKVSQMVERGCKYIPISIDGRGTNPIKDSKLIYNYYKIFKQVKPDIILTYTTKVCIYAGIVAGWMKIPYIMNVSGLGTATEQKGPLQPFMLALYRAAARKAKCVFFQNTENQRFFREHNLYQGKQFLIPGSGVNLSKWNVKEYPDDINGVEFLFIARILKEKGIEEYVKAAEAIKADYPSAVFHVLGACDGDYKEYLEMHEKKGTIIYHGEVQDTSEYIEKSHCTIHPSYYPEGISNVLLESEACGRPVITTDRSGCRETVDNGVTGYVVPQKDTEALIQAVQKFMQLANEQRKQMGLAGRRKVEAEFDRQIVVEAYVAEIGNIDELQRFDKK